MNEVVLNLEECLEAENTRPTAPFLRPGQKKKRVVIAEYFEQAYSQWKLSHLSLCSPVMDLSRVYPASRPLTAGIDSSLLDPELD